jgi:5-methylcytosine-specific restriction endonuclease McrA
MKISYKAPKVQHNKTCAICSKNFSFEGSAYSKRKTCDEHYGWSPKIFPSPSTKICATCKIEKPFADYYKSSSKQSRVNIKSDCKKCESKTAHLYKQQNKNKLKEYRKAYDKEVRDIYLKAKNKPCTDCGKTFPHVCMDLDHVRGIKIDAPANLAQARKKQQLLLELEKCEPVCSNCHRIRTWNRNHSNDQF